MRVWLVGAAGLLMVLVVGLVVARAVTINAAYNGATASIDSLRRLSVADPASMTPETLVAARGNLRDLETNLQRLDEATSVPVSEGFVTRLPWLGPRFAATRALLRIGALATDAGTIATEVGEDVLHQPTNGGHEDSDGSTWVNTLAEHQDSLTRVASDLRAIKSERGGVEDDVLPDRIRARLAELDRLLARPEVETFVSLDVPSMMRALGTSSPARYLVLFQNPAELRPSGGFPGTIALVTVEDGQVRSYEFHDAHELAAAYLAQGVAPQPEPWAIAHFFSQGGLLPHDALWWSDFPRSGREFMELYAESGWPAIDGVIAVQPEVASRMLGITGPFDVDFQGQTRHVTADNVYEEIDRQRQLHHTPEDGPDHKDMLGLIGKSLIDRLKHADRKVLGAAAQQLLAACQQRDLQVYMADPNLEAALDRQGCTGRLTPDAQTPTLAITYANLVLSKTSLDMRPKVSMSFAPPEDGQRRVNLTIVLRNGAVADEDPYYQGFQRWWVEVNLPDGSTLLSDPGPMANPDSPNGGSYLAALFPDTSGRIDVVFSMPDSATLLMRRQPGVRPGDLIVGQAGCQPAIDTELKADQRIDLDALCQAR